MSVTTATALFETEFISDTVAEYYLNTVLMDCFMFNYFSDSIHKTPNYLG